MKDGYNMMVYEGGIQHDGLWRMDTTWWSMKDRYNMIAHDGWIQHYGPWRTDTTLWSIQHDGPWRMDTTWWPMKDGYNMMAHEGWIQHYGPCIWWKRMNIMIYDGTRSAVWYISSGWSYFIYSCRVIILIVSCLLQIAFALIYSQRGTKGTSILCLILHLLLSGCQSIIWWVGIFTQCRLREFQ